MEKYIFLFLILLMCNLLFAQSKTGTFSSSGIHKRSQKSQLKYTADFEYKVVYKNELYTELYVKIRSLRITSYQYEGRDISSIINVSYPINIQNPSISIEFFTTYINTKNNRSFTNNVHSKYYSITKNYKNRADDGINRMEEKIGLKQNVSSLKLNFRDVTWIGSSGSLPEIGAITNRLMEALNSKGNNKAASTNNGTSSNTYGVSNQDDSFWSDSPNNTSQGQKPSQIQQTSSTKSTANRKLSPQERDRIAKEEKARQAYEMQQERIRQQKELEATIAQHSQQTMSEMDRLANGDEVAAGIGKAAYTAALAAGGVYDANSAGQAIGSLINGISANAKRKREEKARHVAIAAEKRRIAAEEKAFLDGLISNRKQAFTLLPEEKTPNSATSESIQTSYYFAVYESKGLFKEKLPSLKVTDIFAINRYKDGSWPFQDKIAKNIETYSNTPHTLNGYFGTYEEAYAVFSRFTETLAKNGVAITFISASEDFDDPAMAVVRAEKKESDRDFWGNPTETEEETEVETKTPPVKTVEQDDGFWGTSIGEKETDNQTGETESLIKKDSVVTKSIPKKEVKDKKSEDSFWGKSIDIKK